MEPVNLNVTPFPEEKRKLIFDTIIEHGPSSQVVIDMAKKVYNLTVEAMINLAYGYATHGTEEEQRALDVRVQQYREEQGKTIYDTITRDGFDSVEFFRIKGMYKMTPQALLNLAWRYVGNRSEEEKAALAKRVRENRQEILTNTPKPTVEENQGRYPWEHDPRPDVLFDYKRRDALALFLRVGARTSEFERLANIYSATKETLLRWAEDYVNEQRNPRLKGKFYARLEQDQKEREQATFEAPAAKVNEANSKNLYMPKEREQATFETLAAKGNETNGKILYMPTINNQATFGEKEEKGMGKSL